MTRDTKGRPTGRSATMPGGAPFGLPILPGHSFRHAVPEGSLILTPDGPMAVETLMPGDRVVAGQCGVANVRDVVRISVSPGASPVRLPAHVLGRGRPARDLVLPADQPLILRGWRAAVVFGAEEARVSVSRLIDGRLIRTVSPPETEFWSIVLDRPTPLHVDGLELISASRSALGSLRDGS